MLFNDPVDQGEELVIHGGLVFHWWRGSSLIFCLIILPTISKIQFTNKLYYFVKETTKYNRLMNYYGEICNNMEKPTLNSMREVETASTLFYYEVN